MKKSEVKQTRTTFFIMNNPCNLKVGIPRAISYYNNYPFYYGFFNHLGIEVILSDKTTTKIINQGAKYVVSDTCLPIKVYVGHIINLLDKECEYIFVPSIQSTGYKINNCSKIRGLPEIVRNVIDRPFTMVEPTLDKTEGIGLFDFCVQTAKFFNIFDKKLIREAMHAGWDVYNNFHSMTNSGVPYSIAIEASTTGKSAGRPVDIVKPLSVAIMGHGYNLFDDRISLNLIKKLEKMDVKVYTSLDVTSAEAISSIENLGEIQYWANELELTGTAAHFLLDKKVDGIIALSAFGCGPDSLMVDEIAYHCKERNMPLIHLTIDEHTGEAGFVTRIEAFVDMLMRKKRAFITKKSDKFISPDDVNVSVPQEIPVGSAK